MLDLIKSVFLNFFLILKIGALTSPKIFAFILFERFFFNFNDSISNFFSLFDVKINEINLSYGGKLFFFLNLIPFLKSLMDLH